MTRTIVGIDGSENSAAALRWAANRAERRRGEIIALFAWTHFDHGNRAPGEGPRPRFSDAEAERLLDAAIAAADIDHEVTRRTVEQFPPEALVELADPDDLIVVGARGLDGFEGLLLGSASNRVVELSPCPVAVIRGRDTVAHDGEIVVGVDDSERSMLALRWAAAEATANGATLRIVHAWQASIHAGIAVSTEYNPFEEEAAEFVAKVAEDPSLEDLTVEREVAYGSPAQVLLTHDADASMLVVASRGRGAFKRFLLGSTSRQIAHHATSPVVVIPGTE